jgi:hypothetical protein
MRFCGIYIYTQFVRSDLQRLATARAHVPEYRRIPADLKRAWSLQIRHAVEDILLHRTGAAQLTDPAFEAGTVRDWVYQHRSVLVPDLPPGVASLYYDLTDNIRPWIYFQHMVEIVRRTEASQFCRRRRLRSPFILRNGLIPGHFTLDTNSAMQLLMDRAAIGRFKARFHLDTGIHLPGMTTKGNMCAHYSILSGMAKAQVTPEMEARFKDAIWCFMFNRLGVGRRTKKLLAPHKRFRFDHSLKTDGYSVSVSVSDAAVHGRKAFKPRGGKQAAVGGKVGRAVGGRGRGGGRAATGAAPGPHPGPDPAAPAPPPPPPLPPEPAWKQLPRLAEVREWALAAQPARAAGDPGKGTLLQVIDQAGRKLRYTAKQRRRESGSGKRAALDRRLKRKTFGDLGVPEAATCGALLAFLFSLCSKSKREAFSLLALLEEQKRSPAGPGEQHSGTAGEAGPARRQLQVLPA